MKRGLFSLKLSGKLHLFFQTLGQTTPFFSKTRANYTLFFLTFCRMVLDYQRQQPEVMSRLWVITSTMTLPILTSIDVEGNVEEKKCLRSPKKTFIP
jgi:hypothetical protein